MQFLEPFTKNMQKEVPFFKIFFKKTKDILRKEPYKTLGIFMKTLSNY